MSEYCKDPERRCEGCPIPLDDAASLAALNGIMRNFEMRDIKSSAQDRLDEIVNRMVQNYAGSRPVLVAVAATRHADSICLIRGE